MEFELQKMNYFYQEHVLELLLEPVLQIKHELEPVLEQKRALVPELELELGLERVLPIKHELALAQDLGNELVLVYCAHFEAKKWFLV